MCDNIWDIQSRQTLTGTFSLPLLEDADLELLMSGKCGFATATVAILQQSSVHVLAKPAVEMY